MNNQYDKSNARKSNASEHGNGGLTMYHCVKNPDDMTNAPCNRACPYYWQCVERSEEQAKEGAE